jgi:hypothetical protein
MERRQYLALAGGVLAGLAGRTDSGDADTDPGGGPTSNGVQATVTGTLTANGTPALDRLDAQFAQHPADGYYLGVATAREHGERLATALAVPESGNGAPAFFRDTDYGAASVVCIQDQDSSSVPDLEMVSARVAGDRATPAVRYPGKASTDDITTDLLFARPAHPSVEQATVTITAQTGTTTRLRTAV